MKGKVAITADNYFCYGVLSEQIELCHLFQKYLTVSNKKFSFLEESEALEPMDLHSIKHHIKERIGNIQKLKEKEKLMRDLGMRGGLQLFNKRL